MISTFYIIGFSLFTLGTGLYVVYSVKLSRDLKDGAIPVQKNS